MNRTTARLALPALLSILLCARPDTASAYSLLGEQKCDMLALRQLASYYRHKHGEYPETDSQSTWFQKLVADDPSVRQCVHFGTTPDGSLPTDMYGFAIVYELPANPNDSEQLPVVRCVGKNGRDDKGGLDDWDIRYGPNLGYWYKANWPRLYVRTGVCALLALLGVALLRWRWRSRPWWWAPSTCALFVGFMAFAVVPGSESWIFRRSGTSSPWRTGVVGLFGAGLLLIGIVGGVAGGLRMVSPSEIQRRRRERWRQSGCCMECGYDLRGTVAAGKRRCPECGALMPVDMANAAGDEGELWQ